MLAVTQSPTTRSDVFRIDVALRSDSIRTGRVDGSIRIRTDDRRFPELIVPVRGEVEAAALGRKMGADPASWNTEVPSAYWEDVSR
jgi:hypothetical protein